MLTKRSYGVTFPTTGRTLAGEFDFKPGFGLITGANEQGKSLIIEVVRWCLFGSAALRGKAEDYKTLRATLPDTQLLFIAGPLAAAPYLPPFRAGFADSFSCRVVLLRPESRGSVRLSARGRSRQRRRMIRRSAGPRWCQARWLQVYRQGSGRPGRGRSSRRQA